VPLSLLLGADRLADDVDGDCPNSVMATAASKIASSCRLWVPLGVEEALSCLRVIFFLRFPVLVLPLEEGSSPPGDDPFTTGLTPSVKDLLSLLSLAGEPRFRKAKL
jgi:hypothetical protein